MDIFLIIVGFIFIIVGIAGSILPVLPGPPLAWVGLLFMYLTKVIPMDYWVLGIALTLAIIITILDYVIPAVGTKKFGGTKYGMWGTTIGLIIGLLIPIPLGFLIGSIVGAFVGELIYDSQDTPRATKAAIGSFVGFISATFLKLVVTLGFLIWFIKVVWQYKSEFF